MRVAADARLAFCFPGQGSQAVGMGRAFHEASPAARAVFEEASDTLGLDVAKLQDGSIFVLQRAERMSFQFQRNHYLR
jgi:[acyl-carrier-protein] S-malonyltransferase